MAPNHLTDEFLYLMGTKWVHDYYFINNKSIVYLQFNFKEKKYMDNCTFAALCKKDRNL